MSGGCDSDGLVLHRLKKWKLIHRSRQVVAGLRQHPTLLPIIW